MPNRFSLSNWIGAYWAWLNPSQAVNIPVPSMSSNPPTVCG